MTANCAPSTSTSGTRGRELYSLDIAAPDAPLSPYDVVGPICETSDTFTRGRMMPELKAGDLVAFMSAGAYGAATATGRMS